MNDAFRISRKHAIGIGLSAGFLLAGAKVQAQSVLLAGTVVDAVSGQPAPFAVVEIRPRHLGVQASEQGEFTLNLPVGLTVADSLRVSSLGFAPRVVPVPIASPCRLALQPLAVALPETVVRPPAPPVCLGPTANGTKFGFSGGAKLTAEDAQGWQVARKFTDAPAGTVQAVRFYLKPGVHCGKTSLQAPFRVRLYAANGPAGHRATIYCSAPS